MRVFLTGASGFIGSFFLKNLIDYSGHEVCVLLRNPTNAWRIKDMMPNVKIIIGELDELINIEAELKIFCPDAFVHLAWNGVSGGERNESSQWRNVSSTLELIELANRLNVKNFIGLGSQAEYGPCQNKIDESCATKPTTMYGASKLAAQLLSEKLCGQYGLRYAWLRLFSSFGPEDNPDWLIPYLTRSLLTKKIPKLTAAEQLWDYIYVEDVAFALRAVLDSKDAEGVFNLGSGQAYKLRAVIEKIRDLIDPNLHLGFGEIAYRSDQVMYLQADISKISKATGWMPKSDFDLALKKTVEWFSREGYEN